MSEWVADVLDRPQVILAIVPLGALYVGIVDLLVSRGFAGTWGSSGSCWSPIAYLAQSLVLLVPRWVQPGYATVVISLSSFDTDVPAVRSSRARRSTGSGCSAR